MKISLRLRTLGSLHLLAVFVPLALAYAGCSSGDDAASPHPTPDGSAPDSSSPDASGPDGSKADSATPEPGLDCSCDPITDAMICTPHGVWAQHGSGEDTGPPADDGFTYSDLGGLVQAPPPDAGCPTPGSTFTFSNGAATLEQRTCGQVGSVDRVIHLTNAQASQILQAVEGLQTVCDLPTTCGADFGDQSLVVTNSGTGASTHYTGDFYAGCAGTTAQPPFIDYMALSQLGTTLQEIASAACAPDDAGDAGPACTTVP